MALDSSKTLRNIAFVCFRHPLASVVGSWSIYLLGIQRARACADQTCDRVSYLLPGCLRAVRNLYRTDHLLLTPGLSTSKSWCHHTPILSPVGSCAHVCTRSLIITASCIRSIPSFFRKFPTSTNQTYISTTHFPSFTRWNLNYINKRNLPHF